MSLVHNSKVCYSNEMYYDAELDTFEMSQQRQLTSFVNELIQQKWLTTGAQTQEQPGQSATLKSETQVPAIPMSTLQEQGSNLLRFTRTKALQNLRRIA